MNEIVHFEIPVDDLARAQKFYKSTFGWQMNHMKEMDYTMVQTTETDERNMPKKPGSINGGMMKRSKDVKAPVVTISVADINAALTKIEKNGGKTLVKKMEVGTMGWSAYFKDSEGNVVGLWQNKM
ncbi:MAG: VOC family protein [Candidatus Bathyarchaeota archaeon]|nr:VOC family protein [Candidatus Bathyarchaeota archaeon]